jgi:hypothetical protein
MPLFSNLTAQARIFPNIIRLKRIQSLIGTLGFQTKNGGPFPARRAFQISFRSMPVFAAAAATATTTAAATAATFPAAPAITTTAATASFAAAVLPAIADVSAA